MFASVKKLNTVCPLDSHFLSLVNLQGLDPLSDTRVQIDEAHHLSLSTRTVRRRRKRDKEADRPAKPTKLPRAVVQPSTGPPTDVGAARSRPLPTAPIQLAAEGVDDGTCSHGLSYPTAAELYAKYPASRERCYKVEASFETSLPFLVRDGWLDDEVVSPGWATADTTWDAKVAISQLGEDYARLIEEVPRLAKLDFSPLLEPRHDYATQTSIPQERIDMMGAAYLHYGDMGLVARYVDGEFLGAWRDHDAILDAVAPHVSEEVREHMDRVLNLQVPASFNWEEPAWHKAAFLNRGNSTTVARHAEEVTKTLNKEERNHHVMPFPGWLCRFASTARHVPQTVIDKEGKSLRLIWNGTDKAYYYEDAMNDPAITPTTKELECTFGYVYLAFCVWLWNLRISYPDEEIYLAFIDISSCFRWPRICPDLIGAFGFVIGQIYFAANAMVFGSVVSASTWEPFRRAIAALATGLYDTAGLVEKHAKLLSLVKWVRSVDGSVRFARATACGLNPGVFDSDGKRKPTPHWIYVDDNLLADILSGMRKTLAAAVEAIFTVLGRPKTDLRKCAVALDKWEKLVVSYRLVLLGLEFNTRLMTVGIPDKFRREVCELLHKHWHAARVSFDIGEIEQLIGKLGRIAQVFRPMYHLMGSLYKSVAHSLRDNEQYLINVSSQFRAMMKRTKLRLLPDSPDRDVREVRFAARQTARKVHRCKQTFTICATLREELAFITALLDDWEIPLCTPIGHIVPREPRWTIAGDACTSGGGGWSTDLRVWWHWDFTEEIIRRAALGKRNSRRISINVLETVVIIINYAAAMYACHIDGLPLDDFPVLLNLCDNTSACSWINKRCRDSLIGRRLGRMFAGMLLNNALGIQAEWLSTHANVIADEVSRVKRQDGGDYDYSQLLSRFPELQSCRRFHPSPTLLSLISSVLVDNVSPDPLMLSKLEPKTLGSFGF